MHDHVEPFLAAEIDYRRHRAEELARHRHDVREARAARRARRRNRRA